MLLLRLEPFVFDTSCLLLIEWNDQVRLHDWQHCSSDHRHTASETNIRAGEMIKNSFLFQICSFETDVSDLITFTRLTFSLAGGQVSSLGQLWTDGGNPHCQVLVLIFLFSFHSPCIAMCKCLCRHHNIQIITFTFCCNLYKTLHLWSSSVFLWIHFQPVMHFFALAS